MEKSYQKPLVVAMTGASGSIYGLRFVKAVTELGIPISLTLSHAAGLVLREELGIEIDVSTCDPSGRPYGLEKLFNSETLSLISYYPEHEMTAPIASGSYPTRGMVIIPCSTTSFSKIANGISENLIERAAECMIKEGRRLVIVPRETPLSAIHLENLLKLARVGVRIVPAIPAFYSGAQKIEELIDFVIGKVLDQFEIPHALYRRWVGSERK
ncbi:MAG: UbiX family flavin prenyltransferase [Candidatus Omnitrophica bacterium]|nr:UbiX family flavin prenyltransferase [Candidatus Omnitrophota bacterium]